MNNQDTEIIILTCAAVSGWLTAALGWFKWWHEIRQDRVKLKIDASMTFISDEFGNRAAIVISAVNNGRRVAKIKGLSIPLSKEHEPIPMNVTPEQREQFRTTLQQAESNGVTRNSRLSSPDFLEISPDGGSHRWELPLRGTTKFLTKKRGRDTCGQGYIELTSGKQIPFYFTVIPDEHLEQLRNAPRP